MTAGSANPHMPNHPETQTSFVDATAGSRGGAVKPVFGRLATAMVTPFAADGSLDLAAARVLARQLVEEQRNDTLVLNGTTGESPTTTDDEKSALVREIKDELGDQVTIIAGVGSNITSHSVELAHRAVADGADGVLLVTPYYSKPTQRGIVAHFQAVATATELPLMVYDIPGRSGVPIETATLIELAQLPTVIAVKDAKADLVASAQVMAATDLDYYSGDDALTLPLLSLGAVGLVGTSTHFTGAATADLLAAWFAGDAAAALQQHRRLLPSYLGVFAEPGCSMVKGTLAALGRGNGVQRSPMVAAAPELVDQMLAHLSTAGLIQQS